MSLPLVYISITAMTLLAAKPATTRAAAADKQHTSAKATSTTTTASSLAQRDTRLRAQVDDAMKHRRWQDAEQYADELIALRRLEYPRDRYPDGHVKLVRATQLRARLHAEQNQITQALAVYRQAETAMQRLVQLEPSRSDYWIQMAEIQNAIGNNRFLLCRFEDAARAFQNAITSLEKDVVKAPVGNGPQQDSLLAQALVNYAFAQERLQDYDLAEDAMRRSLQIYQRIYPRNRYPKGHLHLALQHEDLGRIRAKKGHLRSAITSLKKSVDMFHSLRSPDGTLLYDADLAVALLRLGTVYLAAGKTPDARSCLEEALILQEETGNASQRLSRAAILDALLSVAVIEGDLAKTTDYRRQIEQIIERVVRAKPAPVRMKNVILLCNHLAVACMRSNEYGEAERFYRRALQIREKLTPQDTPVSKTDPLLISTLSGLATLYQETARFREAYEYQSTALKLAKTLYPAGRYPRGHRLIVISTINLGTLLWITGETEPALDCYRDALMMSHRLWPRTEFPNGSQLLLDATHAYADALRETHQYAKARRYYQRAQDIALRLYPQSEFPKGHKEWETAWIELGQLELCQGHYDAARDLLLRAVESHRRRCRMDQDSTDVALALDRIGQTYRAQGNYASAIAYYQRSLACRRRLFPADAYPHGHPYVAKGLRSLGRAFFDAADHDQAYRYTRDAAAMECELARQFAQGAAEPQILNYVAKRLLATDLLISSWQCTDRPPGDVYVELWKRRGLATELITEHHRRVRALARVDNADYARYMALRHRLVAALTVSGAKSEHNATRLARVRSLNAQKETLERKLSALPGPSPTPRNNPNAQIQELVHLLPTEAVFLDFVRFDRHQQAAERPGAAGHTATAHYGVFVLCPGEPIRFADLGTADSVDDAIESWRDELLANRLGPAGHALYERLWAPIASALPAATTTVYITPDGPLASLPWSALPIDTNGHVLLEKHAIATVPSGKFLLRQLRPGTDHRPIGARILAIGNVDYGGAPKASTDSHSGLKQVRWNPLPQTGPEIQALAKHFPGSEIHVLTRHQATVARVLAQLPQATMAHFATHGFFVDTPLQTTLALAEGNRNTVESDRIQSRRSIFERNPFLLSGLVLADANVRENKTTSAPSFQVPGILTAQEIVGLDCRRLQLVVLSGCKTCLGSRADGNPFGLQTAFHVAGARNVIASLWDVDDQATMHLMRLFYAQLAKRNVAPLEALRRAQLAMLGRPEPARVMRRGPVLTKTVTLKPATAEPRYTTAQWAAWSLSGSGSL